MANTWSLPQPMELANSYSPCCLRTIPTTGDLLCVWNQVRGEELHRGFRRSRLSLAISTDDGGSWGNFKTLEVGGPVDRSDRIAPDEEIGMVRGEKELGELPADMIYVSYPNAHFFGDEVVLLYDFGPQLLNWMLLQIHPRGRATARLSSVRSRGCTSRYSYLTRIILRTWVTGPACNWYRYTPLATR